MLTAMLLRVGSLVLQTSMGSFGVFCLYWAGKVSNPDAVRNLIVDALILGGLASLILYGQSRYLDR